MVLTNKNKRVIIKSNVRFKGGDNINSLKERILNASIELFYKKGFVATGVREISKKAKVSPSMINYHFGSKNGILKEIMELFFSYLEEFLNNEHVEEKNFEERIRTAIKSLVLALRNNEKMFKIIMTQIPDDDLDLIEYRTEKMKKIILGRIFLEEFKGFNSNIKYEIIGPALSGMIFSHFLLKDIATQISGKIFDDEFYEIYPDYIADIFLYGALKKLKD
ncbi:TetR/AcrR family transcriptional regulator [Marinitoga litoralis]|uniref:TetR/AcrR family transcriptional regulator n=1 Tax=Marinitoga litoralis TaxID=570855 RepID=UPI001960B0CC|nr:TetR family transcriptional regulator [Marinitoga litoralis]MBM7558568.1 AcrR family transcriptional regulator [Marinitoga litoralis]